MQLDISYLHVFTYSERAGTKALEIEASCADAYPARTKQNTAQSELHEDAVFYSSNMRDKPEKYYLKNTEKNGMMEGYTDNYIRITTPYRAEWANKVD